MATRYILIPIFLLLPLLYMTRVCETVPLFGKRTIEVQKESGPDVRGFRNQAYNRGGKAFGKRFMDHFYLPSREMPAAYRNAWNRSSSWNKGSHRWYFL